MKLLFYLHGFSGGGAERVAATMANYYHRRGDSVCVGCDTSITPVYDLEPFPLIDILNGCRIKKWSNNFRWFRVLHILNNIRRLAKQEQPDAIISFITYTNLFVLIALLGLRYPVIVCEHTNVTRKKGWLSVRLRKILYPFASAVTVLTHRDYQIWQNSLKNVVYMPNPCSLPMANETCTNRDKVILAVGRVNQWYIKGFDLLMKAWSNIAMQYPDWELHIVGKGDDNALRALTDIVPYYKQNNIKFLGFRKDVYNLMLSSSIFVLSSRTEGLPMALIEAMNAGCCCVAFDIETGPKEIIRHNYDGILIPAEDINTLQMWLSKLIEDTILRNKLASKAPESMKRYSVTRIMNRWNILLTKVTKHK